MKTALRILILLLIVAGIAAAVVWRHVLDPRAVQGWLALSPFSPLIFVLLQVAASLLFVPRTVLGVAAGLLFGFAWGVVWALAGAMAGAAAGFALARWFGIGGVLEPLQAGPTIIEDNCFVGARSEIVEGVVVEENSVLAMGVFISQSTRIYDRATGEIHYGRVPAGSVVVPGSLPAADGSHSLACAVIVKRVDAKTRAKTSINDLLRA